MRYIKDIGLIAIVFSFLFYSCKKDKSTIADTGQNYFPIKAGAYIMYNVDSTFYDDFFVPTKVINTKFRLKEKIQSLYYDDQNRLTARLERYVKYYSASVSYDSMPWTLKNIWVENLTSSTAEKVEENVRYVRLVFPVKVNKSWNVNNQNFLDELDFTYKSVDAADNVGGIAFDSVLQTAYDDGGKILTTRNYFSEKYAKKIGLVYKQEINVASQPPSSSTPTQLQIFYAMPILQRITSGYQYTWTIYSYGFE